MDVVILNGASSSGKSSIAKALQAILPDYYLHMGIDTFIAMMPEKSNALSRADEPSDGFYWQTQQHAAGTVKRICSGTYGKQVNRAYHSTVKHLANSGLKVIVDDVMNGEQEQQAWLSALVEVKHIFVGVMCDEHTLAQRERSRPDRINGSAIEQACRVHQGVTYDITVSTSKHTANECAQLIRDFIFSSRP
ncbi:chloramphenicol phosphotransferase CPT family protein [Vibrio nitrifigilis]|uniref:AAA family ATPase n=1 Tax=Vibrio nitrifigilis TaxID=2789781 RepID=A0ABS0GDT8_9VIBR|nr:AAA family ATPase [Vibrio nitrifigilis]MBF9000530.1 AAA family ATPase [Vibrio nitrifigilis]